MTTGWPGSMAQKDVALRAALEDRPEWPEPYTIIKAIAARRRTARRSTPPTSGSIRCGPPSTSVSTIPDRWLTSGGLGTMGYGLPAAIGAKMGDAGLWKSGRSSATADSRCRPTSSRPACRSSSTSISPSSTTAISGWSASGKICSTQKNYSEVKILGPDFVKLAEAYGVTGIRVTRDDEIVPAIERGAVNSWTGSDRIRDRAGGERLADRAAGRQQFRHDACSGARSNGHGIRTTEVAPAHARRSGRGSSRCAEPGRLAAAAAIIQYPHDHRRALGAAGRLPHDDLVVEAMTRMSSRPASSSTS